jgi:hypothetical protein
MSDNSQKLPETKSVEKKTKIGNWIGLAIGVIVAQALDFGLAGAFIFGILGAVIIGSLLNVLFISIGKVTSNKPNENK